VRAPAVILGSPSDGVFGHCMVPGCGRVFYRGEEQLWQRHVGECARAHLDEIRQHIAESKQPVFESFDPEVERYLQKVVGPRMLEEGRLEVKPHERAGF
jgi:hypothetical protein